MLSEILGELGWNTYMVGKWHLCPTVEMNLASTRRNWPTGRGFRTLVRLPRRGDEPVVSRPTYDNHPVDQPKTPRGGLPIRGGHHRQGDRVHHGREGLAPEKPFFLHYAPGAR